MPDTAHEVMHSPRECSSMVLESVYPHLMLFSTQIAFTLQLTNLEACSYCFILTDSLQCLCPGSNGLVCEDKFQPSYFYQFSYTNIIFKLPIPKT